MKMKVKETDVDDFNYVTPEQAVKKNLIKGYSVEQYRELARSKEPCSVCGRPAWKLAETGLCFTCTTGEADASDDYELEDEE